MIMAGFFLWQDRELQDLFIGLGFEILDFKPQVSKVRANDIWLGYVLKKQ